MYQVEISFSIVSCRNSIFFKYLFRLQKARWKLSRSNSICEIAWKFYLKENSQRKNIFQFKHHIRKQLLRIGCVLCIRIRTSYDSVNRFSFTEFYWKHIQIQIFEIVIRIHTISILCIMLKVWNYWLNFKRSGLNRTTL